ncbi:cadmium/zinc-transporting ATPase HMA1 [Pyrus ussuriensis x Pyrus communis]|uniref:Cadmium/zinc-transporting ATPase HMA1 n=1 Tax=Pyrus ussuriensis x Pyrus communis TaxID=2448454 RepID=A0A5N5FMV2_9ROSA|nr:cadmium/zinc-transporting ATPase HMA1 [Pyrus ussuriensis x Pyrus communis]
MVHSKMKRNIKTISTLEHFHRGWDRSAHSQKNGPAPREVSPTHRIAWHPTQASLQASLKLTDLGTGPYDAMVMSAMDGATEGEGFQHNLYVRNHKNRIENLPR